MRKIRKGEPRIAIGAKPEEREQPEGRTREQAAKELGIGWYLLERYIASMYQEAKARGEDHLEGYTHDGVAGYVSDDLLEQLRKKVAERPEKAPDDGYSFSALQRALECKVETVYTLIEKYPPRDNESLDSYGTRLTPTGGSTTYYTPRYLGKLRIALAQERNTDKIVPWQNKRTQKLIDDPSEISKLQIGAHLGITIDAVNRLMENTQPYADEIGGSDKRKKYPMRYLARLEIAHIYGVQFDAPKPAHERQKEQMTRTLQRLELQLQPIIDHPKHRGNTKGLGLLREQASRFVDKINDLRKYMETIHSTEGLEEQFFIDDYNDCMNNIPKIAKEFHTVISAAEDRKEKRELKFIERVKNKIRLAHQQLEPLFDPISSLPEGLPELQHQARALIERLNAHSVVLDTKQEVSQEFLDDVDNALITAENLESEYEQLIHRE